MFCIFLTTIMFISAITALFLPAPWHQSEQQAFFLVLSAGLSHGKKANEFLPRLPRPGCHLRDGDVRTRLSQFAFPWGVPGSTKSRRRLSGWVVEFWRKIYTLLSFLTYKMRCYVGAHTQTENFIFWWKLIPIILIRLEIALLHLYIRLSEQRWEYKLHNSIYTVCIMGGS